MGVLEPPPSCRCPDTRVEIPTLELIVHQGFNLIETQDMSFLDLSVIRYSYHLTREHCIRVTHLRGLETAVVLVTLL